uniref:Putative secreted peptide n=1 Tax=Anopheles braziliensis TaxID=58242 RepID=A0A2M3ZNG3_9DIPT
MLLLLCLVLLLLLLLLLVLVNHLSANGTVHLRGSKLTLQLLQLLLLLQHLITCVEPLIRANRQQIETL